MAKALYLKCEADEIGEHILLTGDPARVHRIGEYLTDAKLISQNREFWVLTGTYKGLTVSAVSAGIGAPSAAIAIEELTHMGARSVIRVGTMMGVKAPIGAFVISAGAARYEGTSSAYLPLPYPAIPDWHLANQLLATGQHAKLDMQIGITATYDSFYTDMAPSLMNRGALDVDSLAQHGVLAIDMETALLYTLGIRLRIATASICLVTNSAEPFAIIEDEARATGEGQMIQTTLDGIEAWSRTHG